MKKLFLVLIFISSCISNTYTQHLNFLGISIDGNIDNFQSKLLSQGIKLNNEKSRIAPIGQRHFWGKYHGYNAKFTVFYNRKLYNVYKVKVEIHSKNKEFIKGIFNKSTKTIESKYKYDTNHYLTDEYGLDEFGLHYQYYIKDVKSSRQIGVIQLITSQTFSVNYDNGLISPDGYAITIVYEDAINTANLTPATSEPRCNSKDLICNNPNGFETSLRRAFSFMENDCYDESINSLTRLLDYYKYNCIPQKFLDSINSYRFDDELISDLIISLQGKKFGEIKTAYASARGVRKENVYVIQDESGVFKYIQYDINCGLIHVKLSEENIKEQIIALENLKPIYIEKKGKFEGKQSQMNNKIDFKIPAIISKDIYGVFKWEEYMLDLKFEQYEQELLVRIYYNGYEDIFLFRSEKEIDEYLNLLKHIQRDFLGSEKDLEGGQVQENKKETLQEAEHKFKTYYNKISNYVDKKDYSNALIMIKHCIEINKQWNYEFIEHNKLIIMEDWYRNELNSTER